MDTLGEVISLGIWEGILKTLKGKYFKSTGSNRYYFYFPEANVNSPLEVSHKENFRIYEHTKFGDIKLRVIQYKDDVFNPTKIMRLISINELFLDYVEISKNQFDTATANLQKEIDKFV